MVMVIETTIERAAEAGYFIGWVHVSKAGRPTSSKNGKGFKDFAKCTRILKSFTQVQTEVRTIAATIEQCYQDRATLISDLSHIVPQQRDQTI